MKKIAITLVLVCALFFSGCAQDTQEQPIGGQRNEYGCLVGAGYSYDSDVEACTRNWELNNSQKQAAKTAVEHVGKEYGLTVTEVLILRCSGCFDVKLQKIDGEQRVVRLSGMVVVDQ